MPTRDEMIEALEGQDQEFSKPTREQMISELQASHAAQPPQEMSAPERWARGTLNALPAAGGIAGGLIGAMGGPVGMFAGGVLGAAGGKTIENIGETLLGDKKTRDDIYIGPAREGAVEALGMGAGSVLAKGAQKISQGLSKKAANFVGSFDDWIAKDKPDADEIRQAARALGFEPTPGMVNKSDVFQNLESSLSQSPSIPGYIVRRGQKNVADGLAKSAGELTDDAAQLSAFEVGDKAKKEIAENVASRFKSPIDTFNDLKKYTKDIKSTADSTKAVSRNIMKIPEVEVLDLPLAKQVVAALEKNPTADQIKTLRTMVGQKARTTMDGAEAAGYRQIYEKLGRLEENTIKRGVIASSRSTGEGKTIAEGMLGQLKSAKKGYATQMENVRSVSDATGLKSPKSLGDFKSSIDDIPAEKLGDRFFNLGNKEARTVTKNTFPEAFQTLRKGRLSEIREKAMLKGNVDAGKLVRQIDKLEPEALTDLFRDAMPKATNMKKVIDSLPGKVGPSGTPQGMMYSGLFDLAQRQVTDFGRYAAYKGLSSDTLKAFGTKLKTIPELRQMAEAQPDAFNVIVANFTRAVTNGEAMPMSMVAEDQQGEMASAPKKGPEKWADDGFNKILKSSPSFAGKKEALLKSPKAKKLLIAASSLPHGSRAMDKIIKELMALEAGE